MQPSAAYTQPPAIYLGNIQPPRIHHLAIQSQVLSYHLPSVTMSYLQLHSVHPSAVESSSPSYRVFIYQLQSLITSNSVHPSAAECPTIGYNESIQQLQCASTRNSVHPLATVSIHQLQCPSNSYSVHPQATVFIHQLQCPSPATVSIHLL
jgi:hypothetical protein